MEKSLLAFNMTSTLVNARPEEHMCTSTKSNHIDNGIQPAVALSNMVGKKKENP
jgi:hypothetical protein